MRILLVWPNRAGFGFKPIGLSLLSALLKEGGHEVRLFDTTPIDLDPGGLSTVRSQIRIFRPIDTTGLHLEKQKLDLRTETVDLLESFRPELVGVSALSDECGVGLAISGFVKEWDPGVPVVWGNKAATMAPERILHDAGVDYVCIGEGFGLLPDLAAALAAGADPRGLPNLAWRDGRGEVHRNPLRPYHEPLDDLPFADWTIFDRRHDCKPFNGRMYVGGDHMICWGCPYSCTYCINDSYRALYAGAGGHYLRRYSVDRIIRELRSLVDQWGVTFFKFHDEDFCLKPMEYFRTLSRAYADEVGVPFTAMANARNVTPEKVRLLREMGCVSVSIGIESGNEGLRREVLKRRETKAEIIDAVHLLADAGIRTSGFNMIGIPHETRETVLETIQLNRDAGVDCADTGFFYPLEGTELYDMAVSEGLFDPAEDQGYDDVTPNLRLPGITGEELVALRERFALLVKLPEEYVPFITRSETDDEVGRRLFRVLLRIYEEAVLGNDDTWDSRRSIAGDLRLLSRISGEKAGHFGAAA
jgi:anaerobic magnesium-protoporphyrin IX monomethyl ester cyclase